MALPEPPSQTLPPHEGEGLGLGVKIVYKCPPLKFPLQSFWRPKNTPKLALPFTLLSCHSRAFSNVCGGGFAAVFWGAAVQREGCGRPPEGRVAPRQSRRDGAPANPEGNCGKNTRHLNSTPFPCHSRAFSNVWGGIFAAVSEVACPLAGHAQKIIFFQPDRYKLDCLSGSWESQGRGFLRKLGTSSRAAI